MRGLEMLNRFCSTQRALYNSLSSRMKAHNRKDVYTADR